MKNSVKFKSVVLCFLTALLIVSCDFSASAKARLNHKSKTIYTGKSFTLKLNGGKAKSFKSSEKSVATVSSKGIVKGRKAGKAVITVKAKNGKKYKCRVTVKSKGLSKMYVTVKGKKFTARLYNNNSAKKFKKLLPMTLNMSELNGNEKYYYFGKSLPANEKAVSKIKCGDIMLYGDDCLVLFYKTFKTSYNYTKLGYIENPSSLAKTVGNSDVSVKFSLK